MSSSSSFSSSFSSYSNFVGELDQKEKDEIYAREEELVRREERILSKKKDKARDWTDVRNFFIDEAECAGGWHSDDEDENDDPLEWQLQLEELAQADRIALEEAKRPKKVRREEAATTEAELRSILRQLERRKVSVDKDLLKVQKCAQRCNEKLQQDIADRQALKGATKKTGHVKRRKN
jgi:integrase